MHTVSILSRPHCSLDLTCWVLRQAVAAVDRQHDEGFPKIEMTVKSKLYSYLEGVAEDFVLSFSKISVISHRSRTEIKLNI